MTQVTPGDIIFSFAGAEIRAIGEISAPCQEGRKPKEFGNTGQNWEDLGWLVHVDWEKLEKPIRPKDHIEIIAPLLSDKYAPLQKNGNGNQGCYLASISQELAETLLEITGCKPLSTASSETETWQHDERAQCEIEADETLSITEKKQLVSARRGQGKYRENLEQVESHCHITGTTDKHFLIASHIKPWRDSDNQEKLDGHNGFLMAPHIDKLFDAGWISFSDNGDILVASNEVTVLAEQWSIDLYTNAGPFSSTQKQYLAHHRQNVFKAASI